jgi:SAM-dependent methyltransferase
MAVRDLAPPDAATSRPEQPWVDDEMAWLYDFFPNSADLPLYLELAAAQGDRVLELACGTGRVLVPLARAGHRVVGIDTSPAMLARARAKLATAGRSVAARARLLEGDMRDFALDEVFDLAIIPSQSFAYLLRRADQQRVLAAVAAHLRPGGLLALHLLNPTPAWLSEPPGSLRQDIAHHDPAQGLTVARTEAVVSTDLASQVRVIRSAYEIVADDGSLRKRFVEWPYRYTYRFEAEHLLERAGFTIEGVYGGPGREAFTSDSRWLFLVARRA